MSGIFTPSTWQAPTTGTGDNYHIYQQDIDWNKMDNKGRINLHHSNQKSTGPLFELSASTHTKYGHTNALHPYRVTPNADGSKNNPFGPVKREKFDIDRKQYWKDRAQAEIDARKLNYK